MWSTIFDLSQRILAEVGEARGELDAARISCEPPQLGLAVQSFSISPALVDLGLTPEAATSCDEIISEHMQALAEKLEADFAMSWRSLDPTVGVQELQVTLNCLRRMYAIVFGEGLEKIRTDAIDLMDGKRRVWEDRVSEQKTWDSKTNPRAKELLEDVFQKNQNPNAAEKQEMAIATGLTKKQITTWFSNRRQRSKQYETPRRRKVTARKASSSSIDSMPSLSSSVSSSSSSQSWDADLSSSPIRQQEPAEVDFAAFLRSISPTPTPMDQPLQESKDYSYPNFPTIEPVQLESPSSQPSTILQNWEPPLVLEIPSLANYLDDTAPPPPVDLDMSIGDDFWQDIIAVTGGAAAGQQPLEQDDPFANITITQGADDRSAFFASINFVPATPSQCSLNLPYSY